MIPVASTITGVTVRVHAMQPLNSLWITGHTCDPIPSRLLIELKATLTRA